MALFAGRKTAIKAALLNQSLLHGVGNIYADESLFRAGIRPTTLAGRISKARLLRLRESLKTVLVKAIELGGSSVSDYVDADGVRGFFQLEHRVYGRSGKDCVDVWAGVEEWGGGGTDYGVVSGVSAVIHLALKGSGVQGKGLSGNLRGPSTRGARAG